MSRNMRNMIIRLVYIYNLLYYYVCIFMVENIFYSFA